MTDKTTDLSIDALLRRLELDPETVEFEEVIATIDEHYQYRPTRFLNGVKGDLVVNEAGQNVGSCRIFAFARLHGLNTTRTLHCFGRFFREEVLEDLSGTSHANIRTFMRHGWKGIQFEGEALVPRL